MFQNFFKSILKVGVASSYKANNSTLFTKLQYYARRTVKNKQVIDAQYEQPNETIQPILDPNQQKVLMEEAIQAFQEENLQATQRQVKHETTTTRKINKRNEKQNVSDVEEEDVKEDKSEVTIQKRKAKRETIMDKREKFQAIPSSPSSLSKQENDIEDSEVRRIQLLKDRKVQEQIQFERLRKASMSNYLFLPTFSFLFAILDEERLSKYLSRSGVCSRRQAEKMISDGLIKVDGKVAESNLAVTPRNNIEIFTKRGEKFAPVRRNAKIWIFYKPRGLICSHDDPHRRPTIFDYIYTNTKIKEPHIIAVGRLDFNSEGLILLTNDGDIAQCLEQPESHIYRKYRVRVQGKLDENKLLKLKSGVVISGVQYGPFHVEIDKRQTTNTWLNIGLYTGKNREIRKVMQKLDLKVSKLKRESYGPYHIGKMLPGQIFESYVNDEIKRKIYLYMRKKLELKQDDMKAFLFEKFGEDIFLDNKSQDELSLDAIAKKAYNELDKNSLKTQLLE